jgi:hypothetical protein
MLKILFLTAFLIINVSSRIISDEQISIDDLKTRITAFNKWYKQFNPSAKVEAGLTKDNKLGLFATEEIKVRIKDLIKKGENYLFLERKHIIDHRLVYDTKIGPLIKKAEQERGYSDYTNNIFYLLHEMDNPSSQWKPYLDLLPRQPSSLLFNYWKIRGPIEEELPHTPVLSNKFIFISRQIS